jgi:ArsR family transcriptional regulator
MNIKSRPEVKKISQLLRAISSTPRLHILLAIGTNEACVCHLEVKLGLRQAYISQHLMDLRKAKVLTSRREGRFIFYRLSDPRLLELIQQAGEVANIPEPELRQLLHNNPLPQCCCPNCMETLQSSTISLESLPILNGSTPGEQLG